MKIAIFSLPGRGRREEFQPLLEDAQLHTAWVRPEEFTEVFPTGADIIVLPGSSKTITDLKALREAGGETVIREHLTAGGVIVGVCGGYQMLGHKLYDPGCRQGNESEVDGFGLLPIDTLFGPLLMSTQTQARFLLAESDDNIVTGQEHRSGCSWVTAESGGFLSLNDSIVRTAIPHPLKPEVLRIPGSAECTSESVRDGVLWAPCTEEFDGFVSADRKVWGTYLHLIFHNASFRQAVFSAAGRNEQQ